jgi:hypothetical protein
MRFRFRAALVATTAAVALAVFAGPASAHHIDVSASVDCQDGKVYPKATVNSQRGDYRFKGTATASEGNPAEVAIPAGGGSTSVQLGPVSSSGSVRVVGDFWKPNGRKAEHMDRTAAYPFLADCKAPPPVTEEPPAEEQTPPVDEPEQPEQPKDDEPQGSSTSRKRTVRTPKAAKPAPPAVVEQAPRQPSETMSALPFTGPREDMQRALALGALVLLAAGSLLVAVARRREARVRQ